MTGELTEAGLTPAEEKVSKAILDAIHAFYALPVQHPSDQAEFARAAHQLQQLLAIRIARREYPEGWPTYPLLPGTITVDEVDPDEIESFREYWRREVWGERRRRHAWSFGRWVVWGTLLVVALVVLAVIIL